MTRRNSVDLAALSPYMRRLNAEKLREPSRAVPRESTQCQMPGMETSEAVSVVAREVERRKRKTAKAASKEDLFDFQLRSYELPAFERQVKFAKEAFRRNWSFDFANHQYRLAIEVEGLVVQKLAGEFVVRGHHASISGFKEDAIKYAHAAILGWTVLRFEQSQIKDGTAIDLTQRVLFARGWSPSE